MRSQSLSALILPLLEDETSRGLASSASIDELMAAGSAGDFSDEISTFVISSSTAASDPSNSVLSFCACLDSSSCLLNANNSAANQLIAHHKPPQIIDSMTKWILCVAISRDNKTTCRAPNDAFVATRSVGVGPGVKMLFQRSSMNAAMLQRLQSNVCMPDMQCCKDYNDVYIYQYI